MDCIFAALIKLFGNIRLFFVFRTFIYYYEWLLWGPILNILNLFEAFLFLSMTLLNQRFIFIKLYPLLALILFAYTFYRIFANHPIPNLTWQILNYWPKCLIINCSHRLLYYLLPLLTTLHPIPSIPCLPLFRLLSVVLMRSIRLHLLSTRSSQILLTTSCSCIICFSW
jgi:hypothetical protein